MKVTRALAVVSVLGAAGALQHGCGGMVQGGVAGTLDDGGTLRAPDGAILFSPGSACAGFDAAAYFAASTTAPDCPTTTSCGYQCPACGAWAVEAGLAFGEVPTVDCDRVRDGGTERYCDLLSFYSNDLLAQCNPGPAGDAYCQAFFQRFALHGKTVVYSCNIVSHTCEANDSNGGCGQLFGHAVECRPIQKASLLDGAIVQNDPDAPGLFPYICVRDNGDERCEPICTPP